MTGSATIRAAGRELAAEVQDDVDHHRRALDELMNVNVELGQIRERRLIVEWLCWKLEGYGKDEDGKPAGMIGGTIQNIIDGIRAEAHLRHAEEMKRTT